MSITEKAASKSPWDTDLTFLTQSYKRTHLNALLMGPDDAVQSTLNALWNNTSHNLITEYRRRIRNLDGSEKQSKVSYERRRVLQHFHSFLTKEKRFYVDIISRTISLYSLDEYKYTINAIDAQDGDHKQDVQMDVDSDEEVTRADVSLDYSNTVADEGSFDRNLRAWIIYRCLIYIGDLLRYKELYNEEKGRPKAGQHVKDNGKRRIYTQVVACYNLAKSVNPHEALHFNSLAVVCSYNDDNLGALYHYYRCITTTKAPKQPQNLARNNITSILNKVLDESVEENSDGGDYNVLVKQLIKIHAMLYLNRNDIQSVTKLVNNSTRLFRKLLDTHTLNSETITRIVAVNICLYHSLRTYRQIDIAGANMSTEVRKSTAHKYLVRLITHLMRSVRVSLEEVDSGTGSEGDDVRLSHLLTTSMRRSLPALRLSMHWLISNIDHHLKAKMGSKSNSIPEFWSEMEYFRDTIHKCFYGLDFPKCGYAFDEDEEFSEFEGVKRCKFFINTVSAEEVRRLRRERHPNEDQFDRVMDVNELVNKALSKNG
ncbi:hypothetical protein E3P81_01611 [Wallemia ichthyophaga]|nr:hypothetical protein E3P97_01612 [Wallemia ichthyophaga]TIA95805.1 hypothetical protein E3P95_03533 [Wallemia ichthyophaga]TIA96845.1 hypothetical protein E3P94_03540 [Wallemia ichthyophaga]TIB02206.1 hypothetical protein E3P96_02205 [Wallemia ichthyophaga]TIB33686.1 hypothetical protein E3P85_01264 [Wallemia ichthyophaga]